MLPDMNMHPIEAEAGTHYRRIARAIRYLSQNYREQPRLEEAACVAALSPHHFQRLFTRHVGISPKAFVAALTLDHAKAGLAAGASVLDAALDAGLSGSSRLHDLCIKIEAMTPGEYARAGSGLFIAYGFHDCLFGVALLMTTAKGVCGLAFGDEGEEPSMLSDMKARWPKASFVENPAHTGEIVKQIFEMGGDVPLHLMGTPWQTKVWQALLAVSPKLATYGGIARQLGTPGAARAVGTAVGRNPIAWLIPCHRVLAADGSLHGYHWGEARQRAMLAVEAAKAA